MELCYLVWVGVFVAVRVCLVLVVCWVVGIFSVICIFCVVGVVVGFVGFWFVVVFLWC